MHGDVERAGRNGAVTFGELAAAMREEAEREGLARSTLRGYDAALRLHLLPRFGERPIAGIGTREIAELLTSLRGQGMAENGVVDVVKPLRRTLALAMRRGLLEANPYEGLERAARPLTERDGQRILALDEIESLARAADEQTGVAIGLALFCGLRDAQARGLRVRDFDREALALWVVRAEGPRRDRAEARTVTRRRRVDALGDAFGFLAALAEQIAVSGLGPDDFLVRSPTGGRADRANLSRRYRRVVARAGLDAPGRRSLTFGQLRHNFAALAIRIGTDPPRLLEQLGQAHATSLHAYLRHYDQPRLDPDSRRRLRAAATTLCR